MNNKEISQKVRERKIFLGKIFLAIEMPILLPLLLIHKLGELSETIANIIQTPACKAVEKLGKNYRNKLEKNKKEEPVVQPEVNIGNYEECKKFNENLTKGLDK